MHIYFSGIGGVAIGPLCEIALDAGHSVSGSDSSDSLMTEQLRARGVKVAIGQDGSQIAAAHARQPIDWLVYTAALPSDHPELAFVAKHGIRASKRDELLAEILHQKNLKLIAISGTHGKTSTTGLLIWAMRQLGFKLGYSVGSTLSFGPSGQLEPDAKYFVYECDEFDRNMLHFSPHHTIITSLDHDHFDTYPTSESYKQAFVQFLEQSDYAMLWERDLQYLKTDIQANLSAFDDFKDLSHITLAGAHMRRNAYLVEKTLGRLFPELYHGQILDAINSFPGTARRFEKLADSLYSDYGHHPIEVAATLQMARELSDHVVLVYQPHQNIRQHKVRGQYTDCMQLAEAVYWLPTYLSREDPSLEVLTPKQLTENLTNRDSVHYSELNDQLWKDIQQHLSVGHLVLCMGAGSIDAWLRSNLTN